MIVETKKFQSFNPLYSLEYFIDETGIWYKYDDVTYNIKVGYNDYTTNNIYKNFLNDNEKREVEVMDRYNNPTPMKFINSIGHYRLLERNEQYIKDYRSSILQFEKDQGIITYEDSNNHCLKAALDRLGRVLESDSQDYNNLKVCAKAVYNSPAVQEIIQTNYYNIDPIKEQMIDEYRDYVYSDEYDEIEIKLTKRPEAEKEEKIIKYKRNRKDTTIPDWIKDVVK